MRLCFGLDQFDRKMGRNFFRLFSRGSRECLTVHWCTTSVKSVRDQDLKHILLFFCLHSQSLKIRFVFYGRMLMAIYTQISKTWNFWPQAAVSNSKNKSSKNAKTQENVETSLLETSQIILTGKNREPEKRENLGTLMWGGTAICYWPRQNMANIVPVFRPKNGWFLLLI